MSSKVPAIVIGGGCVGLSIARSLCLTGVETLLIERHKTIGQETSSRNSEVIHAGIYYASGSLKANLCVQGKHLLYDYVKERGISHRQCGKLIVATSSDQLSTLKRLKQQAESNGVHDLVMLNEQTVKHHYEPEIECIHALLSPSTGILNGHEYMIQLEKDIQDCGGLLLFDCNVLAIESVKSTHSRFSVTTSQGAINCDVLINAAGLNSIFVAKNILDFPSELIPQAFYAKGNYFKLLGKKPFNRLVYPTPQIAGLGIHATLDLQGNIRFGPDVEWLKESRTQDKDLNEYEYIHGPPTDYSIDINRQKMFYDAVRSYWPSLPDDSLIADYSGIRPKLFDPSGNCRGKIIGNDFYIQGPRDHGINGLVNLFGIESPGLTSSLAIGKYVVDQIIN